MPDAKDTIRNEMKEQRKELRPDSILKKSWKIMEQLRELDEYKQAGTVMSYFSLKDEADTRVFLREELQRGEKQLLLPFTEGTQIKAAAFAGFDALEQGKYSIMEPSEKTEHEGEIDIVLVPGVAFTEQGYRLGFGKGYYDQFLDGKDVVKIGLAFEDQIIEEFPAEPHDVAMDMIITEDRVIRC